MSVIYDSKKKPPRRVKRGERTSVPPEPSQPIAAPLQPSRRFGGGKLIAAAVIIVAVVLIAWRAFN